MGVRLYISGNSGNQKVREFGLYIFQWKFEQHDFEFVLNILSSLLKDFGANRVGAVLYCLVRIMFIEREYQNKGRSPDVDQQIGRTSFLCFLKK